MRKGYTFSERLYGLLMVSVIIWSLIAIFAVGQIFISTNPALLSLSDVFSLLVFFFPIFIVCLLIGLPSWWIAQKLGFASKTSAVITGIVAMLLVLFAFTGFDVSQLINFSSEDYVSTIASFAIFGAVSGFVARQFAERARIKNGW